MSCFHPNVDSDLDIEKTPNTNELVTKLIKREMLIFKCYQVDSKEINYFFQWWAKHGTRFPIVVFLACQILRIVVHKFTQNFIFFNKDTYKLEKMSFTIKKFREIDICEQKLAKCTKNRL